MISNRLQILLLYAIRLHCFYTSNTYHVRNLQHQSSHVARGDNDSPVILQETIGP